MTFVRFFLSLIPIHLAGWSTSRLLFNQNSSFSKVEKLALSFGVGWGVWTLEMFYAALLGLPWNPLLLSLPWLLLFFWNRKKEGRISETRVPLSPLERKLFLFLVFLFIYVIVESLSYPLTHFNFWDAWSIWGHKAKAFFLARSVDFSFFTDPSRHFTHQDYPLLLPLAESWIYLGLGRINEQTIKLLFPLFYLSFLVLFWGVVRRERDRFESLVSTALLATLPILLEHVLWAYAELPLTFYYTLSTLYLYHWCRKGRGEDLGMGVLFSVFAAWTKNEGIALWGINALLFGTARFFTSFDPVRKKGKEVLLLFSPILFLLPFWLLLEALGVASELLTQLRGGVVLASFGRIPVILNTFFYRLLDIPRWNLLWMGLVLFGGLFWKELFTFPKRILTLALFLHLLLYLFVYLIHPLNVLWAMRVDHSVDRLLLHAAPLALYLLEFLLVWGRTQVPPSR